MDLVLRLESLHEYLETWLMGLLQPQYDNAVVKESGSRLGHPCPLTPLTGGLHASQDNLLQSSNALHTTMFANNYASSSSSPYAPRPAEQLQFFGVSGGSQSGGTPSFYQGAPTSLDGAGAAAGYAQGNMDMAGGRMMSEGKWWEAFGTGGFEGEASLMEGEFAACIRWSRI